MFERPDRRTTRPRGAIAVSHRWQRRLAIAVAYILAATLLVVAPTAGAPDDWQAKVDSSVLQAASAGATDFIVYLEAKADLTPAQGAITKAQKGWFVYDALTTTARQSQAPLVDLLEDADAPYRSFWISNSLVVTGDLELLRALASQDDVRAVYALGKGELQRPVDDPAGAGGTAGADDSDSIDATGAVGPSIAHVKAPDAWALGYRGQGVVVAGADTGVRWTHSAIKPQYRGWDKSTGTADHDYNWHNAAGPNAACPLDHSQPCDDHDHGTHTVGTMVGDDGGQNQIGVAPDAEWIACRNMTQGFGAVPTYMDCMEWFIAPTDIAGNNPEPSKAPDVVNNSWSCVEVCAPPMLKDMIDASRAAGIFYVVSAGNDNQFFLGLTMACNTINFPLGVYDAAFTVGATGATNDSIASFSSLGPVVDNPAEGIAYRKPDIVAPGVGIRSSLSGSDSQYGNFSGTSMAGPHVAGVVALIISAKPELRGHVDTIERVIRETAVPRASNLGCGGDSSTAVPNNVYGWGRIDAFAAVQLALETEPTPASTRELVGLPAQLVEVQKETLVQEHPTTDYSGGTAVEGSTTWRVVKDTGNCCENHLTTSREGRLFDIGGSFINYTDDRGLSWTSVRPPEPLVNGEGSIAMAPNGDVIGMTWDAYSGDHFVAYKYNADTGAWMTLTNVLHQPVYDRPWISVVPGPFTDPTGKSVPYISIVQGGTGIKDPMFVSFDGLLYAEPSSLNLGNLASDDVTGWFPISSDPSFDWIQPIRRSPVTGLGGGYALANGGYQLDPETREWHPWRLPDGSVPPTFIQVDSAGRIHHVRSVGEGSLEYRISTDGGRTWSSTTVPLPLGGLIDFKVNRAVGVSAVALRLSNRDWVYKFDIRGGTARLLRHYRVGLGDNPAGSSIGALTSPRMDFQTVAIFPDGRVAVSFLDSTTFSHPPGTGMLGRITPALAIELDTTLPQADLQVTDITVSSQKPRDGERVVISATVSNAGAAPAGASVTTFKLDGATLLGSIATPAIGPGSTAAVEVAWDTRGIKGHHVIGVAADAAGAVAESDEANNAATLEISVRGNRVQNGSFEQSSAEGEAPAAWTGGDTAAGTTSWSEAGGSDGSRGATISGTGGSTLIGGVPTWTSDAIAVSPGEVLELRVSVSAEGMSSAPGVGLAYLGAAGEVLETVRLADLPLVTDGFAMIAQSITLPPGVTDVRIVLFGFTPGDAATAGSVTFDEVGLYGP